MNTAPADRLKDKGFFPMYFTMTMPLAGFIDPPLTRMDEEGLPPHPIRFPNGKCFFPGEIVYEIFKKFPGTARRFNKVGRLFLKSIYGKELVMPLLTVVFAVENTSREENVFPGGDYWKERLRMFAGELRCNSGGKLEALDDLLRVTREDDVSLNMDFEETMESSGSTHGRLPIFFIPEARDLIEAYRAVPKKLFHPPLEIPSFSPIAGRVPPGGKMRVLGFALWGIYLIRYPSSFPHEVSPFFTFVWDVKTVPSLKNEAGMALFREVQDFSRIARSFRILPSSYSFSDMFNLVQHQIREAATRLPFKKTEKLRKVSKATFGALKRMRRDFDMSKKETLKRIGMPLAYSLLARYRLSIFLKNTGLTEDQPFSFRIFSSFESLFWKDLHPSGQKEIFLDVVADWLNPSFFFFGPLERIPSVAGVLEEVRGFEEEALRGEKLAVKEMTLNIFDSGPFREACEAFGQGFDPEKIVPSQLVKERTVLAQSKEVLPLCSVGEQQLLPQKLVRMKTLLPGFLMDRGAGGLYSFTPTLSTDIGMEVAECWVSEQELTMRAKDVCRFSRVVKKVRLAGEHLKKVLEKEVSPEEDPVLEMG